MQLTVNDGIHILKLCNNTNGNQLTQNVLNEYLDAIKQVHTYRGNTALLITCDDEKSMTVGGNLGWLAQQNHTNFQLFLRTIEELCLRLATLNAPTIACLNGNTYAGGALIMSAVDFRVMREDRGKFCFPEVNIKGPFTQTMIEVIRLLPSSTITEEIILTGKALTGPECLKHGIVSGIYPREQLHKEAQSLAQRLAGTDRSTYTRIKHQWRKSIVSLMEKSFPG